MIQKSELFQRLAEGHAARITVVTPNTRLSQALVRDFDDFQIAKNLSSWEAADILPFDAFVQRLYEDALYSDISTELPMLLTGAQEHQLWKQVSEKADLIALDETAENCGAAWRLMHDWRIRPGRSNEDTAAFLAWSSSYEKKTSKQVDGARLPDLVAGLLKDLKKPKILVAYAFGVVSPQKKEFFEACAAQGVEVLSCLPETKAPRPARVSFLSAKEELEKAAQWARAKLEQGAPRIGVVVPDLKKRRKEVVRVFSRVMRPGYNLPGAPKAAMPFDVSLSLPLLDYPIVRIALTLLEFSKQEISFEDASELIRTPFIAGAEKELTGRAKLDVRLRRKLPATVSLPKLISFLEKSILRDRLEKIFALRDDGLFADKIPSEWARHFSALLKVMGLPEEGRPLDSDEYQTQKKWHETLGEFAKLDNVLSNISFRRAFSTLQRIGRETLFQPEGSDTPIQILEVIESTGMEFEHLWVSGLTDEAWPRRANPNPFLPVALQRAAGMDEASAEGSLERDRRITAGWMAAANEVVFSAPEKDGDRDLAPSPLILGVDKKKVEVPEFASLRNLIFASRKLSSTEDSVGPAVTAPQIKGGTKVLSDQSACPFRAFAHYRLSAKELEMPVDGLDARDRGTLLHELMASLWSQVKNSADLSKDLGPAIETAAAHAVKELGLEGRFAELERARLGRLAREWLEVERKRPPFEVVHVEDKRKIKVGPIELDARIDRMDKIEGGHLLIDYKTSRNMSANQWKVPRPEDPQLPLYAVTAKEEIAAVAFGKVRPGEMRYMGFSFKENLLPEVRKAKDWKAMLRGWKDEAESLGAAFAAGQARVDPKKELQTCRYCDLQTLCRVYEKVNPLKEDEEGFTE